VRGADAAFVSFERLAAGPTPPGFLTVPPELVIEVFGDDAPWAEIERKVTEYHAFGVDAVWVVDPRMLAVRVYPRGAPAFTVHGEEELSAEHPVGFRCRVKELFA
jgi:Uma2 family endonuclease